MAKKYIMLSDLLAYTIGKQGIENKMVIKCFAIKSFFAILLYTPES